ncbi:MAG: quinolinate synthase NadA [Elusimicrobia bacterium]|jgi:quinolinate synthase|nr:quinolinate synthase NadA [Elusimicrobiota bacterium]
MSTAPPTDLVAEIKRLARLHNAVILAHTYQRGEVQDVADFVGDSLALSQEAARTKADVIVFCGVHFMAETAAVLAPTKTVLLPDLEAGCSLAATADAAQVRGWKAHHPGAIVVAYVNTTAEVKAEADYCCTSSNAVRVVESIPADKEILLLPDMFLGQYVREKTGRPIHLWPGSCHVHYAITGEDIEAQKQAHPGVELLVHPECGCLSSALKHADVIASTSGMVTHAKESPRSTFLVATETGILHTLKKHNPEKVFIPVARAAQCEFMKMITLEKVLWSLQKKRHRITVPEEIAAKARGAIERMIRL